MSQTTGSASVGASDVTVHVDCNKSTQPSEIQIRAQRASELSGIPLDEFLNFLKKIGIDDSLQGLQILDSDVASPEVLDKEMECFPLVPILKRKAAVASLKGENFFKRSPPDKNIKVTSQDDLAKAILASRSLSQIKDIELLEMYDRDRSCLDVEEELDRRAKKQPFIILRKEKYTPGSESIDLEASQEQLRRARKGYIVPSIVPGRDGKIVPVYRITELNPEDRIVEMCPICGEILYKGYCSKCELNFAGVGDDERAYVKLVVNCEKFKVNSHSDRKAVHASASKGLEDLRETWPSISPTFDDLKATGSLPRLRMIKNMPAVKVADPFSVNGHRTY